MAQGKAPPGVSPPGRDRQPPGTSLPAADRHIAAARPQHRATQSAAQPVAPPPYWSYIGLGLASFTIAVWLGPQRYSTLESEATALSAFRSHLRTYAAPPLCSVRPSAAAGVGPACFSPRLSLCPRLAGAMQLDPRPATLGLLLLCAAAAGAGEAEELHYRQGEHRADYDREALLGGQVRRPDRRLGGPGLAARLPRALSPRDKGGSRARPCRGSLTMGAGRDAAHSPIDPRVCKLVKIVRPKNRIPSTVPARGRITGGIIGGRALGEQIWVTPKALGKGGL